VQPCGRCCIAIWQWLPENFWTTAPNAPMGKMAQMD